MKQILLEERNNDIVQENSETRFSRFERKNAEKKNYLMTKLFVKSTRDIKYRNDEFIYIKTETTGK